MFLWRRVDVFRLTAIRSGSTRAAQQRRVAGRCALFDSLLVSLDPGKHRTLISMSGMPSFMRN